VSSTPSDPASGATALLPRLAVTAGEPAGIGPELVARLAMTPLAADLVAIADADLLRRAAKRCGLDLRIEAWDGTSCQARAPGTLRVEHMPLRTVETPGQLDARNAFYVLHTLARAADGCLGGEFAALVTAPVQKSIINDAGEAFSGHTEFFAARAGVDVVMMLASDRLRVALATTHLALAAVPAAITGALVQRTVRIVHRALATQFGIAAPRIAVLGLNPHAGEGGHLGREELDVMIPALDALRAEGMALLGPLPADTAFVPAVRERYDAVVAMYHDQALPVLKSEAFERTVNLTLGLPYAPTPVPPAPPRAGAGPARADASSLLAAADLALALARRALPGRP
jgi:4-hydroxythreonine-4-phosphate dehydrogenase